MPVDRDRVGMLGQERDREQRHIGDRMLEAAADEGEEAPEDGDAFAASLVIRADIQIARQTASCIRWRGRTAPAAARSSLAAATVMRKPLFECSTAPPPPRTKNAARSPAPTRLPSHDMAQTRRDRPSSTRPRSRPSGMNMVWPVKRSEPAKMTKRQRDAEGGAHDEGAIAGIDIGADAEDQDDAEADIGAGHHRADPESERRLRSEMRCLGGHGGEVVDGIEIHRHKALHSVLGMRRNKHASEQRQISAASVRTRASPRRGSPLRRCEDLGSMHDAQIVGIDAVERSGTNWRGAVDGRPS